MQMDKPDLTGETDREYIKAVEDFFRWYDHASLKEQAAWHRWKAVEMCLRCRRLMVLTAGRPAETDFWVNARRQAQIRLLRIRIWRTTGVCPGEA